MWTPGPGNEPDRATAVGPECFHYCGRPCSPIPVPPSLFPLKWLKDTKAFKCYGCDSPIQVPGEIHDPPNDVIASTNEYKLFMKDGKLQIHLIYHLRAACIPARIPVNTIGK